MMKEVDTKSRIIDLLYLSESTPVIQRCVSALESALTRIYLYPDITVATKEIFEIYRLRVEMFKHLKLGEIEGGAALVNALEKEPGENVRINGFRTNKEEFLIFTDPELKRLIGCISIHNSHEGHC